MNRCNNVGLLKSVFLFLLVFAVNFRVKAAMKSSVLLTWESRTSSNKAQPLIVRTAIHFTVCVRESGLVIMTECFTRIAKQ